MVEDSPRPHRCRFCNSTFSEDILNRINNDKDDVYCENCGDIIKRVREEYSSNPSEITQIEPNIVDVFVKPQINSKAHPDALNYPIGRIFYDADFPLAFKSNFIIVFSRLICFHALFLERKGQIELGESEIPENALNDLYMSTRNIQDMQIQPEFLNNLHDISMDEFERNLKQMQAKIQSNKQYLEDFHVYTRWLIREVYILVSEEVDIENLPSFERTIYMDLENQKPLFEHKLEQLATKPANSPFVKRRGESKRMKEARINFGQNTVNELKIMVENYEDRETLYKTTVKIVQDAISKPNQLSIDDLPKGRKLNPKYLAAAFIFYGLRHTDFNDNHEKYKLYGVMEYIRESFPNNSTMKTALQTIIPLIYSFLSVEIDYILYFPKSKNYHVKETVKERRENLWIDNRSKVFECDLKEMINEFSQVFTEKTLIKKITEDLLKDAISEPKSFSKQEILESNLRLTTPKYYCVALLFLAYNHEEYYKEKLIISEFSKKYFPTYKEENNSTIPFLYEFLSPEVRAKINYLPEKRYKDMDKKYDESRLWVLVNEFLYEFVDSDLEEYLKQAKALFSSSEENGFDLENLESKNPKYLAATLVYYSLILCENFIFLSKKNFLNYMRGVKFHMGNKVYRLISDFNSYVVKHIEQDKIKNSRDLNKYEIESVINPNELHKQSLKTIKSIESRSVINRDFFLHKLLEIREKHKQNDRTDNVILCDLILKSLEFYEDFNAFTNDIQFIRPSGSPKQVLLRLSTENFLDSKHYLDLFIVKYLAFIEGLKTDSKSKAAHISLLTQFRKQKEKINDFGEKSKQKKYRELDRRTKYGDFFFSHAVRVERFLLMLGLSPYDGYDIWGNRGKIDGKTRIFANFHHIQYDPEEKSKRELVFIPQKPPKKYQKNMEKFLSHSMIAGREGNLKRTDISNISRHKIERELKEIQKILKYNSMLLEKAVITPKPELILGLKGWSTFKMRKAIERLKDQEFSWAKDVEKLVPTAGGYEHERIENTEVKSIIQKIISKRKN
ncbi:MAG: hypothetical protein HWN80_09300 [Candidatus Lokiarchaeota archaeon]|nr:hypothetical protein [Candidatus Lokiarchaeota archaeon]